VQQISYPPAKKRHPLLIKSQNSECPLKRGTYCHGIEVEGKPITGYLNYLTEPQLFTETKKQI
jgi:hypothetical protein